MDNEAFDRLVDLLDDTMFVVTTQADGEPSGCLVGFATQASIHPQRFLAAISKSNHTCRIAAESEFLAVHVMQRRHVDVARLFGGETGDEVDKFERCSWHTGPEGMPVLDDAPAWFVGRTLERIELGDHVGYLLEPVAGAVGDDSDDLVSSRDVAGLTPGHEA
ncbi:flavin reductase family protein [Mycobacterium paraterrae]|uniref:Flavin reductase family protein n=1 Tax=Mycobacterium paraterrae TaxID=577492 RepID=A0ABY3VHY5_9MYCO|nr:flavin reductase family protein [Mycobacterium paraterrae]UMB68062.1 flavin reductase family protein [Mycobacterium paraterrae]